MPVAPHVNNEVRLVLGGHKPLATVEKRKDPIGYALAVSCSSAGMLARAIVRSTDSPEGEVIIVRRGNSHLIAEYIHLLDHGVEDYGIKEYHRRMGTLFGYSPQDIEDFINAEVRCDCAKCTGKK